MSFQFIHIHFLSQNRTKGGAEFELPLMKPEMQSKKAVQIFSSSIRQLGQASLVIKYKQILILNGHSWIRISMILGVMSTLDVVYDDLGVAKKAQQALWTFFCERVADDCGGRRMGEVHVLTEREADDDPDDDEATDGDQPRGDA